MDNFKLSNTNIQKLFPPIIYKRGLDYYKNGFVQDLNYDLNFRVWTARVLGSENYFVEIDMSHFAEGTLEAYCDCPAFDTYRSCKHIAATLISITNHDSTQSPNFHELDYYATNRFIQAISSLPQQEKASQVMPNKTPMQIEYYLKWSYDKNLLVEMKAGEKRPLVVKDAYQFIEDVFQGNEHFFTKTFTYSPDQHYVLQQDMEVLEELYSVLKNEKIYDGYRYYHYRGNVHDKRTIIIPPLVSKLLLEKLVERNLTVKADQKEYKDLSIIKDSLPYHFSLTKNEQNDLVLAMEEIADSEYFSAYEILFYKGIFYFPTKGQVPIIEQVNQFGSIDQQLPISQNQADAFLSEVLPSLKKVGDVQVAEEVTSDIIQVPLRAKLFLEFQDEWLNGKLQYYYGEYEIDPFNGRKEQDVMIIRDVEKERHIMGLIEQANFRYNGKNLYLDVDEEELYDFLYKVLPVLDQSVELYLTNEIRNLIIDQEPTPTTNVRMESSTNLLEIGFDIDGVNEDEIHQILDAVIEKKRYYRLQSGEILSLEGEEFSSIQQLFQNLDVKKQDIESGNIQMPVYRGTQIDELIDTKKHYDPAFRKLLHQLHSPEEQEFELPDGLNAELRNYQMTGYQWFKSLSHYHLGGILADDMGLGKTLQSIAYITSMPSDKPHLIVAPSSVVYNWKNEFEKFSPNLKVEVLTGNPQERHEKIKQAQPFDVWITSYATLRQDIELYQELNFATMILDEAQFIKNYQTKTSRAIRTIKAGRRFALSGTPIENSIDELWAIFQVVLPGLMPNQKTFKQLSNEKIASITKPFILRRLKSDVLKELPEKIESVSVSELTKQQKELYVGYLHQLQQEASTSIQEDGFQKNRMKILAGLTRLRQICCHPGLFMENYEGESGKLDQLLETVESAIENEKRMLIFSQFTSMHGIIRKELEDRGIDYFYLDGQTKSKERVEMTERFNQGEKSVFLISLKAGGTGLNLTGADTVILYDLWWNPAVEDQATGRAHRFGQKNVVQVIRLITEGTIEEKIYELQQKKRELIDQVIQPGEAMLSSLSEEDVRELLSI